MSIPDPDYVTLAQVAASTGRHPELLRQWCAAGRLPCRRVGGSWVLRASDIQLVDRIKRRVRVRPGGKPKLERAAGSRVVAAAFIDPVAAAQAEADLTGLPVDGAEVESGQLELPGFGDPLAVTVVAARSPDDRVREVRAALIARGGRIVADRHSTSPNTSEALSPPKPKEVERIRR
jgi:hypothetical protein